ncbi:MAG: histone deacetylase [Gemmatimonadetes bacterium]|nr:histone deacetylase [Gemmatimonadota bacterium]
MTRPALPVVWHEAYEVDIGAHVFPTRKYRLVRNRLIGEGTITEADIGRPEPATWDAVALVHTPEFIEKIRSGKFSEYDVARLEVPFSEKLRTAALLTVAGSILTARRALDAGIAVHIGGGFHHAFADHGEGFCLLNDVAIAICVLLQEKRIERAAVVDCDVHHGNGTAEVFAHDPRLFTFSIHQERNYPFLKPPSTVDVGLEDRSGDSPYLWAMDEHLPAIVAHRPQIVFYLAGADAYEWDQLGGLKVTMDGLRERDEMVFKAFRKAKVPVAVVLAGGYALDGEDTVEIHCNTARAARAALA